MKVFIFNGDFAAALKHRFLSRLRADLRPGEDLADPLFLPEIKPETQCRSPGVRERTRLQRPHPNGLRKAQSETPGFGAGEFKESRFKHQRAPWARTLGNGNFIN